MRHMNSTLSKFDLECLANRSYRVAHADCSE
jgi:hypothetical protein